MSTAGSVGSRGGVCSVAPDPSASSSIITSIVTACCAPRAERTASSNSVSPPMLPQANSTRLQPRSIERCAAGPSGCVFLPSCFCTACSSVNPAVCDQSYRHGVGNGTPLAAPQCKCCATNRGRTVYGAALAGLKIHSAEAPNPDCMLIDACRLTLKTDLGDSRNPG